MGSVNVPDPFLVKDVFYFLYQLLVGPIKGIIAPTPSPSCVTTWKTGQTTAAQTTAGQTTALHPSYFLY
ncbi:hypothetical protein FKM82_023477 [Ascaphus truei]